MNNSTENLATSQPNEQKSPNSSRNTNNYIQIGLLVTIGMVVIIAAITTYVLKADLRATDVNLVDPNKDARNGVMSLATTVITGCFALLQSNQQSSSPESQRRLNELEAAIREQKKLQTALQDSPDSSTATPEPTKEN